MNECFNCDCYDEDYGCTMPSCDKWYACPVYGLSEEELDITDIKVGAEDGKRAD